MSAFDTQIAPSSVAAIRKALETHAPNATSHAQAAKLPASTREALAAELNRALGTTTIDANNVAQVVGNWESIVASQADRKADLQATMGDLFRGEY